MAPERVLEMLLDLFNGQHTAKHKSVSHKTRHDRAVFLRRFLRELRSKGGFATLPDPRNIGGRHIQATVDLWRKDGLAAATIQTYFSFLRGLAQWVGKPGMVLQPAAYGLAPQQYQRRETAQRDRTWTGAGIDIDPLIDEVCARDQHVGAALRLIRAFGLRRKEAVMMRPHACVVPFEATGLPLDRKKADTYLRRHTETTDLLVTGGDPLVMNARSLAEYLDPVLAPDLAHVQSIRIGTKSVAYWPQRFVSDKDADELLRLFERTVAAGRNLALMAHYSHPRELQQPVAQQALRRIIATGATVRIQAPLIRHVNEDPACWSELWTTGVRLGATPYYMFVERDTGPSSYFKLPLVKAYEVFQQAYRSVSGLARTVRGPSMSAFPGKVMVDGIVELGGEKLLALQFLQARNPLWVRRPFYAKFDAGASWLDELRPAFGEQFFFEQEMQAELPDVAQPIAFHTSTRSAHSATDRHPC